VLILGFIASPSLCCSYVAPDIVKLSRNKTGHTKTPAYLSV